MFIFSLFRESPYIGLVSVALIIIFLILNKTILFSISTVILLLLIYFYRHPKVQINVNNSTVISPAYGRVKKIAEYDDKIHIVIILSPLDIHVQYYPINGTVERYQYDNTGKFNIVYDLGKSDKNEKVITDINTEFGTVTIKQIAGLLVRRISNLYQDVGTYVDAGDKLGMIKFGSRVDLILPKKNFKLLIKENEYVYGPFTKIGYFI